MSLEEITLGVFAACNTLRIFAYIPQIRKAATDENGASAVSCTTWMLFFVAHVSTVAYAIVNRSDWGLAACFAANAVCCLAIVAVAYCKRRRHVRRRGGAGISSRRHPRYDWMLPAASKARGPNR